MSDLQFRLSANATEEGDCLLWSGARCNGHPAIRIDKKTHLIRRALWKEMHGDIPVGKIITTTCQNILCVERSHVELSTMSELTKKLGSAVMAGPLRSAKIAAAKRISAQARITQDDAQTIRASDDTGTALARRYGISESTVSKIRLGRCRKDFSSPWIGLGGRA